MLKSRCASLLILKSVSLGSCRPRLYPDSPDCHRVWPEPNSVYRRRCWTRQGTHTSFQAIRGEYTQLLQPPPARPQPSHWTQVQGKEPGKAHFPSTSRIRPDGKCSQGNTWPCQTLPVGHSHSAHLISKRRPYHPQTGWQKPEISSEGRPLRCSSRWRAPGTPPGSCAGHVQSPGLSNGVGASESVSPFTVAPVQCPLLTGPALAWTQGGSWGT